MSLLSIHNLQVKAEDKLILRGIDLEVNPGEVHAIMGPNGSGKSTLAQVLAGRDTFRVDAGSITWDGQDLLAMPTEERARAGLFLAFQYPVEIPGVSNAYFLKAAVNAVRRHRGLPEFDAMDFLARVKAEMKAVGMSETRIAFKHVLPNTLTPLIVLATAQLGSAILTEAALSFLGLGIPEPYPSWGRMLSESAAEYVRTAPWLVIFPGIAISLAVFGTNLLGDAIRDLLDPRQKN